MRSMKKICELCKKVARMYCESDQANLCFSCDSKVHSANFLVARHSRTLLCHVCQSPTPWTAAGTSFGPIVSSCANCFKSCNGIDDLDDEESRVETESLAEEEDEEIVVGKLHKVDVDDGGDCHDLPWIQLTPPEKIVEEEEESCCSSSSTSLRAQLERKRKREVESDFRLTVLRL